MNFIKRHPLLAYFALVFAISWGGLLILISPIGIAAFMNQTIGGLFLPVYLVTVFGPFIAGILMTALVYGKAGLRDLVLRLFKWKVDARWYAYALVAPVSVFATLFALSILSPEFLPGIITTGDKVSLILFGLIVGIVNPIFEEIGWTGFAIPQLRKRYSVLATGAIMGVMWGAWHLFSNLYGINISSGTIPLYLFFPAMLFSFLPPYRMLMVWIYDRTKSLFLAMMMHGSLNLFWLIATPIAISGTNLVAWYVAWAVVLWAVAAVVLFTQRPKR